MKSKKKCELIRLQKLDGRQEELSKHGRDQSSSAGRVSLACDCSGQLKSSCTSEITVERRASERAIPGQLAKKSERGTERRPAAARIFPLARRLAEEQRNIGSHLIFCLGE